MIDTIVTWSYFTSEEGRRLKQMVYSSANSTIATNAGNSVMAISNAQLSSIRNADSIKDMKAAEERDKKLQADKLQKELQYKANLEIDESQKRLEKEKQKHKLYLMA